MKKTHLLMALLTLFGCSSPANAVEATVMHEDLEARVLMHWNIDRNTRTIANNEELCEGQNFKADELTTIFKDLEKYLTAHDRHHYKINISDAFLLKYQEKSIDFLPIARFIYTIGDYFLYGACNLEELHMTGFVNLQKIGDRFMTRSIKLKTFTATGAENLTEIGTNFLSKAESLEFFDTIWLVYVQKIGELFLHATPIQTSFDMTNLVNLVEIGAMIWFGTIVDVADMARKKFIDDVDKLVEANKLISKEDRRIRAEEITILRQLPERRLVLDELILTYSKAEEEPNSKKIVVKPQVATTGGRLYYSPLIAGLTRHTSHKVQKGNAFKKLPHFILQIIDSYLRYDSVYAALCQNNGPQIRSFVSTHYRRVFRLREMPADFQAQLHDLVEKYKQTHPTYQPEPPRSLQPGLEEQKNEQEHTESEQQQQQNPEEETKEEAPRKRMLKQDGSANK